MFFSTDKVLVKVHPEGKFVVDIDEKNVDMKDVTPNLRVALKNDSYVLHKILPNKVDPLVSLMMVEKVIPFLKSDDKNINRDDENNHNNIDYEDSDSEISTTVMRETTTKH